MVTDKELYTAIKTLTNYCGHVPCGDCKIRNIVHCDYGNEYSEEQMSIPMYWNQEKITEFFLLSLNTW